MDWLSGRHTKCLALVVLLVGLCYLRGHYDDYVFDDYSLILQNDSIKSIDELPGMFGLSADRKGLPAHRAIRNLSYALDYQLWGESLRGYHFTSLLLHVLNVLLVLSIARRLFPAGPWAFAVALLWGVHPAHPDAVTYLSGRRDVLSAFFYLWAFQTYLTWRAREPGRALLARTLALYVIGCFAKEVTVTLPAVIVLHEVVLARRRQPERSGWLGTLAGQARAQILAAPVFFSLLALFPVAFTCYVLRYQPHNIGQHYVTPRLPTDMLTMAKVGAHYLKLMVWPDQLSVDYFPESLPPSAGLLEPATLAALALHGLLALSTVWAIARGSIAGFGAGFWVITFLPMSNLFIRSNEPVAEHYLYLPAVGFAIAAVQGARLAWTHRPGARGFVAGALTCAILALGVRCYSRNLDWEDPERLFRTSLEKFPRSSRLWNNFACHYFRHDDVDHAQECVERALALSDREPLYHYNLGYALRLKGRFQEAHDHYRTALSVAPDYGPPKVALAFTLIKLKRYDEALALYQEILTKRTDKRAWYFLHWQGVVYREKRDYANSRKLFAAALDAGKRHPETLWQLSITVVDEARGRSGAARQKLYEEAVDLLKQAIGKDPTSAVLIAVLGDLYLEMGRPRDALMAFKGMAVANEVYAAEAHLRLARTHMALKEPGRAREEYESAKALGFADKALEESLRASPSPGAAPPGHL